MTRTISLFYCFSHRDRHLQESLDTHLSALKRQFMLVTFSKYALQAGEEVDEALKQLEAADIILLLVSPDFIDSDYCYSTQMELALERHRRKESWIIPILLRPTDWQRTPLRKLKVLPGNKKPVTSWKNQDEAFQEISKDIRRYLEQALTRGAGITSQPDFSKSRGTDQSTSVSKLLPDEPVKIEHYLYISDKKVMQYKQQLSDWSTTLPSLSERFDALKDMLTALQKRGRIQRLNEGHRLKSGEYLSGHCSMRWGVVNWSMKACFFFSASTSEPRVVLMAGSASHLWSNRQPGEWTFPNELCGVSGSDLPGIMSAIEFAAQHSNVRWTDGIGGPSDYLFALGFMQGKCIHQMRITQVATAFPMQMLTFTALVLNTLQPPTRQELRKFFDHSSFNAKERKEILRLLEQAPEIVICTPLYVKLGDDEETPEPI